MAGMRLLHRMAVRVTNGIGRVWPRKVPERPVLDAYRGYGSSGGLVLRGRVLGALRRTAPDPEHSRWQNLRQMASLFFTDEVAGVRVVAPDHGAEALSDEEGYVTLEVPGTGTEGWQGVDVEIAGDSNSRVQFRALVPSASARCGIISDIDDTMLETGSYSLLRNLWTTFTGSALTRRVFPDAVVLMDHLSDHGRNPVYYVSSSPWNLHHFLDRVFERAGLQAGPMFLRDLGIDSDKFITGTHGDHKGDAIERILAATPKLPFILMGDTGQHDAQVYLEACRRNPCRIRAVILREPGPGADAGSRAAMKATEAEGVTVVHGPDFAQVAGRLERAGISV